ncbi:MAG: DNA primase [Rhodocyclaceae bacterium]|nr:DNA primase [Rhodocyclaceae bacterium]
MIPESFIEELLSRVDIVDVIERYVPLKKAGANYQACCPFHSEKTPSFTVSPTKQFYHCFGCGAHGSAIGFLMQYSGLGFVEAVEALAAQLGLAVPHQTSARAQEKARQQPLTERLARAARFYKDELKRSPKAIDYLKGRGLTGEIAAKYGLGYAPDDWQALAGVFADYADPAMVECGLVIENEQGRRYDRFRDRIMFPIQDARGNVIGFGGRVLGQGEPKYLNSPETPLFKKGEELYGLPQARAAIRSEGRVIVVEGYMDVVALAQFGIGNAVATLGTATTPTHVRKLLRLADQVVFCFDGDAAGRKAAWRALEASLEALSDGKLVGFLFLPPEHDPDSFVRAEGAEAFQRLAAQPTTLAEFFLRELKAGVDLSSAEGRARLVHEAKPLLTKLAAPLLRLQLTRALAEAAQVSPAELEALCGLKPLPRGRAAPPKSRPLPKPAALERTLLLTVLHRPERAARLPLELIPTESAEGAALAALVEAIEAGRLPTGNFGLLLEYFRGSAHEEVIAGLAGELEGSHSDEGEEETVFQDAIERLKARSLERRIEALIAQERAGTLTAGQRRQLAELIALKKRLLERV